MMQDYEFAKTTQRFVVLVARVTVIRKADAPYIYLTKEAYAAMGGVYPPRDKDGNWGSPDPKDKLRITIAREDSYA